MHDTSSMFASGLDLGPKPRLGYTDSVIDRAAEHRSNPNLLREAETAVSSGVYAVAGEMIILRKVRGGLDPMFAPTDVRVFGEIQETVFLGLSGERARFGFGFMPNAVEPLKDSTELFVTDLRSIAVQGLVAPEHLAPLAEAKAMLAWHARHRFCANCGAPTQSVCAGWKRECASCGTEHFPRTDPVAIMLAIDGERCLLGRQTRFPPGTYSCLAGFIEPGETIEDAVRRETLEEAGVRCGRVRYFASQPWPFPMSLMIGAHAEANSTEITVDRNELEDARWFDRDEVARMLVRTHPDRLATPPPIAIAHHIIRAWVEQGSGVFQ